MMRGTNCSGHAVGNSSKKHARHVRRPTSCGQAAEHRTAARDTLRPMRFFWVVVLVGCTKSSPQQSPPPPPPPQPADAAPVDVASAADAAIVVDAAVPVDAAPTKPTSSKLKYMSDCSLSNPIARDPCSGAEPPTNGLASCTKLAVKAGDACKAGAARCWVPIECSDGRVVPRDYLECVEKQAGRCFTRSSRELKRDIEYLSADELAALASQVAELRIARYRYKDSDERHLGFITEDAADAAFVTPDGRRVDLYALLSASIVALQAQDARIKVLEARCK